MSSGIYAIENTVNNKIYIGKSKNIEKRWVYHKCLLRSNRHPNSYLQNSWNKYGEKNFIFFIIENCSGEETLNNKEKSYIEQYDSMRKGFNNTLGGDGMGIISDETRIKMSKSQSGKRHTVEAKIRMSNSQKGHLVSDETRDKISEANRGIQKWLGKNHSPESKLKMSLSAKGKPKSEEFKKRVSNKLKGRPSPNKGNRMSDEMKLQISNSLKETFRKKKESKNGHS